MCVDASIGLAPSGEMVWSLCVLTNIATYIHDLNPVIFPIYGEIKLRWYGFAYLMAFVFGYLLLRYLAKRKLWVLGEEKVGDFIAYAAMFGVFVGGRLGYVLFYYIPENGWSWLKEDPLLPMKVTEGGMASHGGILGLVVFTLWYAWKNKVSWYGVGDGLCVVAPIGLFFGRMANFINGELYGRIDQSAKYGMKFPSTLRETRPESGRFHEAMDAAAKLDPVIAKKVAEVNDLGEKAITDSSLNIAYWGKQNELFETVIERSRENDELLQALGGFLEHRYPSQVYEGVLEGLVLFAILWLMRFKYPKLAHGVLTGVFFIGYAVFRIVVENFREPDSAMVGPLTKGQFLSIFMIFAGVVFILTGLKKKRDSVARVGESA